MDKEDVLPVVWTDNAHRTSLAIQAYLTYKFTQREVDNFYKKLEAFENVIKLFPQLHPIVNKASNVRRAVLSKQLSVFYIHTIYQVEVVSVLDNRMDVSKWP